MKSEKATPKRISVLEVEKLLENGRVTIADIRDKKSYLTSNITGSIHLSQDNLEEFMKNTNAEEPLLIYCYHGINSINAVEYFVNQGFKNVYSLDGGVDIVELGIPFSDPIADGPTIQKASYIALQNRITPSDVLNIAKRINDNLNVPLIIMTYCNILYKPGFDNFMKNAKVNGIDGFIIPDLNVEESTELKKYACKHDLDIIFLVSPNTSNSRLKTIVKATSGFLYLVSVFGTTGERKGFEDYTVKTIKQVKTISKNKVPLAVGFGVSKDEHVRFMLNTGADAVIVGSAFINMIEQFDGHEMLSKIESLARSLKSATKIE